MKLNNQKDPAEKLMWERTLSGSGSPTRPVSKLMVTLLLLVSATYVVYTLKLISNSRACQVEPFSAVVRRLNDIVNSSQPLILFHTNQTAVIKSYASPPPSPPPPPPPPQTGFQHVVFGIAASARLWKQRKEYIKIWYKPNQMRGYVWLEKPVTEEDEEDEISLPPVKISGDTSKFPYKNKQGHRSAIRISRIVTETLKLGLKDVRWFVMGDDDTVFVAENLIRVLRKYDHNQMYYIGSLSESHLQNIYFSYGMAYGGGGFAISYPLAVALSKMQDRCIKRYPALYGSDDRMQACMAELGVPLTKELGFHQYDVYGNLFGLLAAHPVAPLVTLHHLDVVEPIFPNMTRVDALKHLQVPAKLDSAGLMQQSICYDKRRKWTVSVSWGFAVQIFRGIFSAREIEMPSRTFLNWYRRADYTAYAFNTRPVSRHPCQKPFVFYMTSTRVHPVTNMTVSRYEIHRVAHPECRWKMANPSDIKTVIVYKKPDPHLWDRSPRRNCCRVKSKKNNTLEISVAVCKEGEVVEVV
ncbi:hypothetical protein ISN45_At05g035980 [Arabidopsis thaliana x Arabidopsis arenosa]|uniref:Transferring glycosyl group transferase (DUF604) n=2 Tax=Arabidopsis TaxID=3701 RepID=A0A178UKB1_ARATH|nr:hypothetical protein ISN45_At05g035980 [Arabidopsis thaliana x Arabidopsis arenosa]OAO93534.1 hypothetical protein AXX17_AT5G39210 [Arabidopsis thaliana]